MKSEMHLNNFQAFVRIVSSPEPHYIYLLSEECHGCPYKLNKNENLLTDDTNTNVTNVVSEKSSLVL